MTKGRTAKQRAASKTGFKVTNTAPKSSAFYSIMGGRRVKRPNTLTTVDYFYGAKACESLAKRRIVRVRRKK